MAVCSTETIPAVLGGSMKTNSCPLSIRPRSPSARSVHQYMAVAKPCFGLIVLGRSGNENQSRHAGFG